MAIVISLKTSISDAKYIHDKSQSVPELTPRSLQQLQTLSEKRLIAVARDGKKIIGWVISEPLANRVFELGLGFVEKPYRGRNILYKMLELLVEDKGSSYVFATFEPRIMQSMREEFGFTSSSLKEVILISKGRFVTKRLSSLSATRRVTSHLKEKKAIYGIRGPKQP